MAWPDADQSAQKDDKPQYHTPPPASGKKIEMTVMYGDVKQAYKVLSIKNTTWYRPGIWLTEEVVDKVCALENWTVTILADELWKDIANFVGGKIPGITIP